MNSMSNINEDLKQKFDSSKLSQKLKDSDVAKKMDAVKKDLEEKKEVSDAKSSLDALQKSIVETQAKQEIKDDKDAQGQLEIIKSESEKLKKQIEEESNKTKKPDEKKAENLLLDIEKIAQKTSEKDEAALKAEYKDLQILGKDEDFDRMELFSDPAKAFDKLLKRISSIFSWTDTLKDLEKQMSPRISDFLWRVNKYGEVKKVQEQLDKLWNVKRSDCVTELNNSKNANQESKVASIQKLSWISSSLVEDKQINLKIFDFLQINNEQIISLGTITTDKSTIGSVLKDRFKYNTATNALPIKGLKRRDYEETEAPIKQGGDDKKPDEGKDDLTTLKDNKDKLLATMKESDSLSIKGTEDEKQYTEFVTKLEARKGEITEANFDEKTKILFDEVFGKTESNMWWQVDAMKKSFARISIRVDVFRYLFGKDQTEVTPSKPQWWSTSVVDKPKEKETKLTPEQIKSEIANWIKKYFENFSDSVSNNTIKLKLNLSEATKKQATEQNIEIPTDVKLDKDSQKIIIWKNSYQVKITSEYSDPKLETVKYDAANKAFVFNASWKKLWFSGDKDQPPMDRKDLAKNISELYSTGKLTLSLGANKVEFTKA